MKKRYIDNKKFYSEMVKYKTSVDSAERDLKEKPPVTDYIGKCFYDIAIGLSFRPNFINYTYRMR